MTNGQGPSLDYEEKDLLVSKAFSPAAPITNRDLFAGRTQQMSRLFDVANQTGQHAVIYGERGVGKTSLAKVVAMMTTDATAFGSVHTCSSGDTYGSIWRRIIGDISFTVRGRPFGFTGVPEDTVVSAEKLLGPDEPGPEEIRRALMVLTAQVRGVLFIDEFDRLRETGAPTLFADTIKVLSDQLVNVTVVPVGVADTLDELIAEHASIERALVQIEMPRMTQEELEQIVDRGLETAQMEAEDTVIWDIAQLSRGLPHYTHLLGQNACRSAIDRGRNKVNTDDLRNAIGRALEGTSQTIRTTYHRATHSNRETLYGSVLLACALAEKDDLNTFGAGDVRGPLRSITGNREYDIPSFQAHLNDFSSAGRRGGVLERRGEPRTFRYRFVDPLLPPYVVMRGRLDGLVGDGRNSRRAPLE